MKRQNRPKKRSGFARIVYALQYSMDGLRAGWSEPAFRQECILALVLIPAAFWLGKGWVERSLLIGSVLMVMAVELVNTAVESAIDRSGTEWHALAKRAKDMGSAAVLITLLWCTTTWADALVTRLF